MVPIRGGRTAPPVEAAISVDSVAAAGSTAGASTPVWAAAACAPAWSAKMASEGTTPRQLTDLIGSLCDLTSGSGDKGTPVVLVQGYFDNYSTE